MKTLITFICVVFAVSVGAELSHSFGIFELKDKYTMDIISGSFGAMTIAILSAYGMERMEKLK